MCKIYICEPALAIERMTNLFIQLLCDFASAASDDSLYCHGQQAGVLIFSLRDEGRQAQQLKACAFP